MRFLPGTESDRPAGGPESTGGTAPAAGDRAAGRAAAPTAPAAAAPAPPVRGRMRRVAEWASYRRATLSLVGFLALAALAVGIWLSASPGTYEVRAMFPSAQSLFTGAPVRLLGVQVGSVTNVVTTSNGVEVTMQVSGSQALPREVQASLATPLLLGSPDIELSPGYTGGPAFQSGGTIPESRTAVPVSTDQLLHQLQRVLGAVKPASAHDLVANLAKDLSGEGGQINQLIHSAAGTLQLLAAKGDDLGRMNGSLASLTSTLDQHESQLLSLVQAYDTVSGVIASHQADLGNAIDELDTASRQLAGLLSPNLKPLEQDVAVVTTAGRTLDRNLSNLDGIMSSSRSLFAGAHRSFDPAHDWIDLNNQLAPGLTSAVVEGLVRDRLAGICRRILANHSSGLSAAEKSTLATCGNPSSGYFDPILSIIPKILSGASPPSSSPPSVSSLLGSGLSRIPGLTPSEQKKVAGAASSAQSSTTTTTSPSTTKHHKKKKSCKGLDGAIDCILGPLGGSGTSGTAGSHSSGSTGTSGLGGLSGLLPTISGWIRW